MIGNNFYKTINEDIDLTIDFIQLNSPTIIPSLKTRALLNESGKKWGDLNFEEWVLARQPGTVNLEFQLVKCSAQKMKTPKFLIKDHQSNNRAEIAACNFTSMVFFDILEVWNSLQKLMKFARKMDAI